MPLIKTLIAILNYIYIIIFLFSPFLMILGFLTPMLLGKYISHSPLNTLVSALKLKLVTSFIRYAMVQVCLVIYATNLDDINDNNINIGGININLKSNGVGNSNSAINRNEELTKRYIFFYTLVLTFAAHEIAGKCVCVST